MKYYIDYLDTKTGMDGEAGVISCRSDASMKTLIRKAADAVRIAVGLERCSYRAELPNVWLNGGVGYLSIDEHIIVYVRRTDNEIYIFQ